MQMSECDNQLIRTLRRIDDAIGKTHKPASPDVLTDWMPRIRVLLNETEDPSRFIQKGIAQIRRYRVVPVYSVVQFRFGDTQNAKRHLETYFASAVESGTAVISPRRYALNRS
jgi:hypothetical protein